MTEALFLHETEAAVVLFDLRGFMGIAAGLAPLDLGVALSRYYTHAEQCIEGSGGRVIKFAGDAVLGVWLADETPWPRPQAVGAVVAARKTRAAFLDRCRADGLPELDYAVAVAAGPVLAGQIGTERRKSYDVLGEPVNSAFKLASLAQARNVDHLLAVPVADYDVVEVEGVELGGKLVRLFRLTEPDLEHDE